MDFQTHFVTTFSPVHTGHQPYLHQDVHLHLARPDGSLFRSPILQDNHRPLSGQTTLNDFTLQQYPGIY